MSGARPGPGYFFVKRAFDILTASVALLLASPALLLAAAAVKLSSPGPVFYRARRAGLYGRPFAMLKFRTMRTASDALDRRITSERDDRVTKVGAVLRRCKIDELPQFWNVLRGEMSVVGPRPEDWDLVQRHYTQEQMRSLDTKPGIACEAEVLWYPDLTYHDPAPAGVSAQDHYLRRHMPAQVAEALRYVDRRSFWGDMSILMRTAWCVVFHSFVPQRKRPLDDPRGEAHGRNDGSGEAAGAGA